MDLEHSDLPKYETVAIPANVEAVKIEPEMFISEEHFEVPIPKQLEDKTSEPPTKKPKGDISSIMSYDEFVEAGKEGGHLYCCLWKGSPPTKTASCCYQVQAFSN